MYDETVQSRHGQAASVAQNSIRDAGPIESMVNRIDALVGKYSNLVGETENKLKSVLSTQLPTADSAKVAPREVDASPLHGRLLDLSDRFERLMEEHASVLRRTTL